MTKILSQDEIDALLSGLDEGEIDTSPKQEAPSEEVVPFDFANYTISAKVKMPGLEVVNDQFSRGFRSGLSSMLRQMVDTSTVPIELEKFRDFIKRIPVPASLHIFKMEPLRGHAIFMIESRLVFFLVERFLGGSGKGTAKVEGREFTPIEQRLIRRVVNLALQELEKAWRNFVPIKTRYVRSEINPQFARIVQPDENVVVCKFELDLEDLTGEIAFCLPMAMLQPIKQKLYTPFQTEEMMDPFWRKQLEEIIRSVEVEVVVPLGQVEITGQELLDMAVGDVIQLDHPIDEPLLALIEGRPKLLGQPGVYRGQKAFQVTDFIEKES